MEMQNAPNYLSIMLWGLYGLGVLFFCAKFGRNLFRIIQKIRKNPHYKDKNIFHVLLNSPVTPHTFFSYIFLNKQKFEAREIPEEVLIHERAHALEKHSLDILLLELLQIVFWFNPFIYFIKDSVKLNHEFLADRAVINCGTETSQYQNILLAFSSSALTPQLANSINYSSTRLSELFSKKSFGQVKKRFTVMKTHTSKRGVWLRSLLMLPLLAILIYGFSTTQVIEKEQFTTSEVPKKEATPQEVAQYNQLAAHWNEQFAKANAKRIIELEDLNTLETLYRKMSTTQKGKVDPFPEWVPPPPIPVNATEKQKQEYHATIDLYEQKYNKQVYEIKLGDDETGLVNLIVHDEKNNIDAMNRDNTVIKEKEIAIKIKNSEVFVNDKPISLKNFANTLDQITSGWNPKEIMNCHLDIRVYKGNNELFLEKLEYEYRKTQLYQFKKTSLIPPPPPPAPDAPPAPKVIKGVNDGDPNVPPPPPAPNFRIKKSSHFFLEGQPISYEKAIKLIEDNKYQVQVFNHDSDTPTVKISTEPFTLKKGSKSNIPPPPPPPEDPMEHIKKMADKGATFFYEDKEVSYNSVIDLVLFNKKLNIQTKTSESGPPVVYISRNFIFKRGDH
jgi:hypothetical protein